MTINNIKLESSVHTNFIRGNYINEVYWEVSGEVNGHQVFYTTQVEPKLVKEIKQELLWVYETVTR